MSFHGLLLCTSVRSNHSLCSESGLAVYFVSLMSKVCAAKWINGIVEIGK